MKNDEARLRWEVNSELPIYSNRIRLVNICARCLVHLCICASVMGYMKIKTQMFPFGKK